MPRSPNSNFQERTTVSAVMIAIDLFAISIMTFGMYFPRHPRRDLVVAFLGVNVGVLAVATALGSAEVGVGLGLCLFGVVSIIRLRSSEVSQTEVAYYFAAGLSTTISPLVIVLMALAVVVLFIGDNPRLFTQYRGQDGSVRHGQLRRDRAAARTRADARRHRTQGHRVAPRPRQRHHARRRALPDHRQAAHSGRVLSGRARRTG